MSILFITFQTVLKVPIFFRVEAVSEALYAGNSQETVGTEHLKPYQWKAGQSGNIGGRPALPDDVRLLKIEKSAEYVMKFLYWLDAMEADVRKNSNAPWPIKAIDRSICAVIERAMDGNVSALMAIFERLFGKSIQPVAVAEFNQPMEREMFSEDQLYKIAKEVVIAHEAKEV